MNSSNSFNICPHCGNSNSLNARFCARCGSQLRAPEEVVVCRACSTRNSPMANFCRNCGSQLKMGEQTKICPKCNREVGINDNTCVCGYSFATISTVTPDKNGKPVALRGNEKPAKKLRSNKGGRGFAIAAFVLLLLFAYLFAVPAGKLRPNFLSNFDKGFWTITDGTNVSVLYLVEYLIMIVNATIVAIKAKDVGIFKAIWNSLGQGTAQKIVTIMTVIFALCFAIHILVCIIRIFSGKRSKKSNIFYLILAILTTLATALVVLPNNGILADLLKFAILPEKFSMGWVVCIIPIYFWFFFIYSAIAKAKTIKEHTA